jgi:hypothetical protein
MSFPVPVRPVLYHAWMLRALLALVALLLTALVATGERPV